MDINHVSFGGRLTKDPETRTVGTTSVTDFSLACNRKFKSKEETKEETTFVDVTLWGPTGEIAQKYLHKGSVAYVEGRLTQETWEAKDGGGKRSKLKITGEKLVLGPKDSGSNSDSASDDAQGSSDDDSPLF